MEVAVNLTEVKCRIKQAVKLPISMFVGNSSVAVLWYCIVFGWKGMGTAIMKPVMCRYSKERMVATSILC
jgi:hypothetical protein